MASVEVEPRGPVGVTGDALENQQSEEEQDAKYMQGWALVSLTVAFMSISFVLALDNTILGTTSSPIPQR